MTTLINDGWLVLSNGTDTMKLACETISIDKMRSPEISHFLGGSSFGYDIDKDSFFIAKASNIYFHSHTDAALCQQKLDSWQSAAPFTLQIIRNTSASLTLIGGLYTTITVLMQKGYSGVEKIAKGDQDLWKIGKITFEEAGARSV